MRSSSRVFRVAAIATQSVIFTLAGCGNGDYPEMARVTGTVAYNGKPVPNMMVNFMPTEGRPSWGKTDADGKFEMVYDSDYKGAKIGHHKVYFTPPATTIDGGTSKQSRKAIAAASGLTAAELQNLRSKYGSESETKLEVDIKNDPEVLDLKLD
ncbi:hypothetical protein SAMN05444166_3581 [Singulisphaera sp. GP187]|uniref:hypothetical protein n=1 Tax=Singulisphaera sp. GP187 TaxID=1882752 RepID=UPI0009288DD2|nr:hypothetical protein [Singulisphaera sp. GP187]SIO29697.1 hypothetical protein SAMN05444166_3581 [Singulisphaera sp. GP187]